MSGKRILSLLAGILLVACTAGDRGYYPLAPGRWWYYTTETTILSEPRSERVFIANERTTPQGLVQRLQTRHPRLLRETAQGLVQVVNSQGDGAHAVPILPASLAKDFKWQSNSELRLIESRTFAPEDRLRGRRLPFELTGRVVTTDAEVRVPVGHFAGCLHLQFAGTRKVRTDRGTHLVPVTVLHDEWYAPGIGLVKVARTESADSTFLQTGKFVQELTDYGK